jgi:tetratricopeptide (TPR) repeat protein
LTTPEAQQQFQASELAAIHWTRAASRLALGRIEDALQDVIRCLELDPGNQNYQALKRDLEKVVRTK